MPLESWEAMPWVWSGIGRGVGTDIPEPRPGSWHAGSDDKHIFTF